MINKIFALIVILSLTSCFEKDNESQKPDDLTILNFQESAKREVVHDSYRTKLRFEQIGEDVTFLQNAVNQKMQMGIKFAKQVKDLNVSTGNYNVNKSWDRELKKYTGYIAYQEIILDSKNKDELLKAAKNLQELGFMMNNLDSYLSDEKRASYRNELIIEALNRVKQRAKTIADNLSKENINIANININANRHSPVFSRAMSGVAMKESNSIIPPIVEPSKQDVSINISVSVNLQD